MVPRPAIMILAWAFPKRAHRSLETAFTINYQGNSGSHAVRHLPIAHDYRDLGIEDFQFHRGRTCAAYEETEEQPDKIEEPIVEADTAGLTDRHRDALCDAADFYNRLLMEPKGKFERVWKYLNKRGLNEEIVKKFKVGFCPPLEDDEFRGRALLNTRLDSFIQDYRRFHDYYRASIFRLLNDETSPTFRYYRQHIDFGSSHPYGVYSDYFAGRITFPIFNIDGHLEGMIGRRPDNRGVLWLRQNREDSVIHPDGWLYGIDKSARGIREYQTAVIVEGIFDFFAFYNISENQDRPIIVSTLGDEALRHGQLHYISP